MKEHTWKERIEWCEAAGLSRKAIADYCGLAYSTVSDICNGNSKQPRGYAAVRLHELSERHKTRSVGIA